MRTKKELEDLIEQETATIKRLENNSPKSPRMNGNRLTTEWAIHETEIKDAYWRRRNWRGKLEDLTENIP